MVIPHFSSGAIGHGSRSTPRPLARSTRPGHARRGAAFRSWDDRVAVVDELARTPGFQRLRAELITVAELQGDDHVLDVGAGTGLLALAAAPRVRRVTAIDISAPVCDELRRRVAASQLDNVDVRVADAVDLPLADNSVDVALSNYCLHHLPNDQKIKAFAEIARVLRPGGRFVLGDMMFEISLRASRDRTVLTRFARAMLRRGPAGIIRLARNAGRLLVGRSEHPASVEWHADALKRTGFVDVSTRALANEGGVAIGHLPERPAREPNRPST
jgi:ubiquinone/menaquinone biosynthesis C-methylase UbiE